MIISWFSGGITSAVATKIALQTYQDVKPIFIETGGHHSDMPRFIADCEKWFDCPIETLQDNGSKQSRCRFYLPGGFMTPEEKLKNPDLKWSELLPEDVEFLRKKCADFGLDADVADQVDRYDLLNCLFYHIENRNAFYNHAVERTEMLKVAESMLIAANKAHRNPAVEKYLEARGLIKKNPLILI